ncbi:MAG: hypothetical protein J6A50_01480, partial [Clostridia bacterium]|nr:hypothetical protein [Clostridia bacterium]
GLHLGDRQPVQFLSVKNLHRLSVPLVRSLMCSSAKKHCRNEMPVVKLAYQEFGRKDGAK